MQTTAVRYQVRPMDLGDISQVMEIERESFPSAWPPTVFRRELQHNRLARYLVAVERRPEGEEGTGPEEEPPGSVSPGRLGRWLADLKRVFGGEEGEVGGEPIVGFVGVWFAPDEAHVVTIAVRESHRRRGIGELMLIAAIELAILNQREVVTLEVRGSNEAAQALYEKYGFKRTGVRRRYYSDNGEDAVIMTTEPIRSPSYQAVFQQLKEQHHQRCGHYQFDFD